jgi:hypothetical protein
MAKADDFVELKDWIDLLSDFYQVSTIKTYFKRSAGSARELRGYVKKGIAKSYRSDLCTLAYYDTKPVSDAKTICNQAMMRAFSVGKVGFDAEIEHQADKAEHWLLHEGKDLHIKEADPKDFVLLVELSKEYIRELQRENAKRDVVKGDSLYERQEHAEELLQKTQQLLYAMGEDIKLPTHVAFESIREIKKETIFQIKCLDIQFNYPISHFLDDLLEEIEPKM